MASLEDGAAIKALTSVLWYATLAGYGDVVGLPLAPTGVPTGPSGVGNPPRRQTGPTLIGCVWPNQFHTGRWMCFCRWLASCGAPFVRRGHLSRRLRLRSRRAGSDDEPLDALVLTIESTYPGVRVRARPNRGGLGQWSTG